MSNLANKNIKTLRQELIENLTLDFFEDEEITSTLQEIKSYDKKIRQKLLALCVVLAVKSSSFVPNTLKRIRTVSKHLPLKDLEKWIVHAFDLLDAEGSASFVKFTSKTDEEALNDFQHPEGIHLKKIHPILEAYMRGISGMELKIKPGKYSYTDTFSIFLPSYMNRFEDHRKNYIIYKIAAIHKWSQIARGTLTPDEHTIRMFLRSQEVDHPDIETFFNLFENKEMALDIYNIAEAIRLDSYLHAELPGLMREAEVLRSELFDNRISLHMLSEKTTFAEGLYQYYLRREIKGAIPASLEMALEKIGTIKRAKGPKESMKFLTDLYPIVSELQGNYEIQDISVVLGRIEPERVSRQLKEGKRKYKKRIKGIISKLIHMPDFEPGVNPPADRDHENTPLVAQREYLLIKGKLIEVDDDVREVFNERGGIPGSILVTGSDVGAGSPINITDLIEEEERNEMRMQAGGIKYDEWDYRRGGYKKHWCSLFEHDIHPVPEPFVELTLQRYGGYVGLLRKRFELIKRESKLLRRQREGNSIDIDAVIEAFSDIHAGLSPTENLFIRLDRQERNIAVLFLLDMSGSTKGWVNQAEKESLVLMCEALEALGDRYAIYGFSGMTRTRCDFYRIKGFEEIYTDSVKKRIAGIRPKDYTRMGPPLRHSIHILNSVEARTKILITLSDGKPEDGDAYKGEYGIEDTRKALIEAREQGIHSFCITIDTEASTYLPHMYGEANYIFIDDVKKLPNRITEIYRRLTT
jgi:nitric oxide reductase NorD protein